MQNLIKRNSGPNRRTVTDGKTLAEKLAQNEKVLAAAADEDEARVAAEPAVPPRPAPTGQGSASEPDDTAAIVAAAKAMRDRYSGQPAPAATAKTCLIVDDSRVIRKVSSKIALSLGYVPVEAENGEEALARCKKSMPDLVLTDWNMPEMDGITFVTKLRSIPTPKEPVVVFCTSNGEAQDIHDGIAAGADDYIVKPFDEAALKAKLEKLGRG
ncbi:CheY-like chemotaxis protein [Erythromicrobium ramosum]|uniref:CheY-like chemotaxis protein n=2 Tax=Erythrobacter ramosus TaxID=35811 RepID=A0ABR6I058_9SPHN|nr:CheY-like chemotaxis protein [Erythrobacter ramosus]